jgi:ABC-type bacteriocin/lantibiotic exporter with double-glycine peptidase domain
MPGTWLQVRHFQQELEYSCVAACVRIVLAHFGEVREEADLRSLLDTQPSGTRAGNIMWLSSAEFAVFARSSTQADLEKALADNQPPIIFLKTGPLGYWSVDIAHAVVLAGMDSQTVALNDPFFADAPQSTALSNFEKAWAETSQFAVFLRPRPMK